MAKQLWTLLNQHGMKLPENILHNANATLADVFAAGVCTPKQLAEKLAHIFHLSFADWQDWSVEKMPQGILSEVVCRQLRCLPLSEQNGRVVIAVSDPTILPQLQQHLFGSGKQVQMVLASDDVLAQQLQQLNTAPQKKMANSDEDTAAFLDRLIRKTIHQGASDIHFEFYEQNARVRLRVDGKLKEAEQIPLALKNSLIARIKVLAQLDIAEKRLPQDGRLSVDLGQGQKIDFRVSTLPCLFGEKIVLRHSGNAQKLGDISDLGFEDEQLDLLLQTLKRPYGMILVCGPTGSGKTRTLYHLLDQLNREEVNIATIEDPVELHLQGVNQVQVNEKQGLDFALALRAFLRQDPDIVMVGEIRDFETADIAVKAAQTGHLMLSTLHTNHASAALTRLLNMGIAPFHLTASLSLVVAQRLVRRLCPHCREEQAKPPRDILLNMGFLESDFRQPWTLYRACGCPQCRHTGYLGRVGVFELLPIDSNIQNALLQQNNHMEKHHPSLNLRRAALLKVMRGETSLEEISAHT